MKIFITSKNKLHSRNVRSYLNLKISNAPFQVAILAQPDDGKKEEGKEEQKRKRKF